MKAAMGLVMYGGWWFGVRTSVSKSPTRSTKQRPPNHCHRHTNPTTRCLGWAMDSNKLLLMIGLELEMARCNHPSSSQLGMDGGRAGGGGRGGE